MSQIILNSTILFIVFSCHNCKDIFTVLLHEIGHALGINHNMHCLNKNGNIPIMHKYYESRSNHELTDCDVYMLSELYNINDCNIEKFKENSMTEIFHYFIIYMNPFLFILIACCMYFYFKMRKIRKKESILTDSLLKLQRSCNQMKRVNCEPEIGIQLVHYI